jgi:hypothetical protein
MQRIFSATGLLLVTCREYSQRLVSYWSRAENILSDWSPIGHVRRIFSATGLLLGTWNILSDLSLIGYVQRMFSAAENILGERMFSPIGHVQKMMMMTLGRVVNG